MSELLGVWIAAALTLCIFSFLYKDNPFFRFAEALFAGISLGYYIGNSMTNTLVPNLIDPLRTAFMEHWELLFPALLGMLLYARYIQRLNWLSKYALAAYVGYYAGLNFIQKLQGEVLPQLKSTIIPLDPGQPDFLNKLIVLFGVCCVLIYFFFSKEIKPGHLGSAIYSKVSTIGTWFIMVSFGAAFGYTVMGRISLLIGRFNFLINDWIIGTYAKLIS